VARLTSITQTDLIEFNQTAQNRAQLGCEKIQGFFYLKLNGGNVWRLRYTDVTGTRRTATIADGHTKPELAARIAADWRQKLRDGIDPLGLKQQKADELRAEEQRRKAAVYLNVGVFFEQIYTPYKLAHARGGKQTLWIIKKYFSHLFERDMVSLTKADIKAWQIARRKKGIKRETLIRDYGAFKAMLNYAVKEDFLVSNPIKDVTLEKKTEAERDADREHEEALNLKRDLLTAQERAQISTGVELFAEQIRAQRRSSILHGKKDLPDLDAVTYPHWFIPFCHIARLTGLRPSDIFSLRWSDIRRNFQNRGNVIDVTPNKTRHHNHPARIEFPIVGELVEVLDKLREQQGSPQSGLLFPSGRTTSSMERKSYLNHWRVVKELAGIRPDIDFYSFRHNFISGLVQRGIPILKIAYLVGHKDGAMIARNYCHHDMDDLAGIVETFSQSWDEAPADTNSNDLTGTGL
jgi:integrase